MEMKVYRPDGESRAIWSKAYAANLRRHGVMPTRASFVTTITDGKHRGFFQADFTPLATATGRAELAVVLQPFETHEEAVAAEIAWLKENWLFESCRNDISGPGSVAGATVAGDATVRGDC